MVEIYAVLNESSANRSIRFDLPTPQSHTLTTAGNLAYQLAHALSGDCKLAEAEAIERELLDVQKRVLGAEHPSTLTTVGNLAYSRARANTPRLRGSSVSYLECENAC
jgi:hypothetical protein